MSMSEERDKLQPGTRLFLPGDEKRWAARMFVFLCFLLCMQIPGIACLDFVSKSSKKSHHRLTGCAEKEPSSEAYHCLKRDNSCHTSHLEPKACFEFCVIRKWNNLKRITRFLIRVSFQASQKPCLFHDTQLEQAPVFAFLWPYNTR